MKEPKLTLVQGTLDLLVLRALADGEKHGYGVACWVHARTDRALTVEEGALYTALHRMEKRKWLATRWGQSENNRRARFYRLTAEGRSKLEAHASTWRRYADAVFKVLGEPEVTR